MKRTKKVIIDRTVIRLLGLALMARDYNNAAEEYKEAATPKVRVEAVLPLPDHEGVD